MKTVTNSTANSPIDVRLVLILIGVVIALISLVTLGLELHTLLPIVSGHQTSSGWFSTVASQAIHWFHAVMIALV